MEQKAFTKELLKIAYAAVVCDGDIDQSELDMINTIEKEDFYLREESLHDEIIRLGKEAKDDYIEFANNTVKQTYSLDFAPTQKMIIINLAIAIVRADGKMQSMEISFIKKLILNLKLTKEMVEATNGIWWIVENNSELD